MRKRTSKKAPVAYVDPFPLIVEAFGYRDPRQDMSWATQPRCINTVSVERYRTTIERIVEPVEVYRERLVKMWRESDNHHDWDKLQDAVRRLLSLKTTAEVDAVLVRNEFGIDAKVSP